MVYAGWSMQRLGMRQYTPVESGLLLRTSHVLRRVVGSSVSVSKSFRRVQGRGQLSLSKGFVSLLSGLCRRGCVGATGVVVALPLVCCLGMLTTLDLSRVKYEINK